MYTSARDRTVQEKVAAVGLRGGGSAGVVHSPACGDRRHDECRPRTVQGLRCHCWCHPAGSYPH